MGTRRITLPVLLISAVLFLTCLSANAQWESVNNGIPGKTYFFTSIGNNLYAGVAETGAFNGVYMTTDKGGNWSKIGGNVGDAYYVSSYGNRLYATSGNYVISTTDNGSNWNQVFVANTLFAVLARENFVVAGGLYTGIYSSVDYGNSWIIKLTVPVSPYCFALKGTDIYAGTWDYPDVYRSTDNGLGWIPTNLNRPVQYLAVSGDRIYAAASNGLYISSNNGSTWYPNSFMTNKNVLSVAVSGSNVFAGTLGAGFFVSTDYGANWVNKNDNVPVLQGFLALHIHNGYIFAGTVGNSHWRRSLSELAGSPVSVDAGEDTDFIFGYGPESVTLTATPSGGTPPYNFLWTPGGETTQSITVSPSTTTTYTVQATDAANTTATDEVTVNVTNVTCGNYGDKVLVCHKGNTICISSEDVPEHLAHGDFVGPCGTDNSVKANLTPEEFKLHNNYPNPFNPITRIEFDIPSDCRVTLTVFDISGRNIATLVNENKKAGYYSVDFNASNLSSGVYFYNITAGKYHSTKRMLLIK